MTKAEAIELLRSKAFVFCNFEVCEQLCEDCYEALDMAIEALNKKTGYWMETGDEDPCWYRCSECGRLYDLDEDYCPNCGTRMRGVRWK